MAKRKEIHIPISQAEIDALLERMDKDDMRNVINSMQEKFQIDAVLEALQEVQNQFWDHFACKYSQSENIVVFYYKTMTAIESLRIRVDKYQKKYPSILWTR